MVLTSTGGINTTNSNCYMASMSKISFNTKTSSRIVPFFNGNLESVSGSPCFAVGLNFISYWQPIKIKAYLFNQEEVMSGIGLSGPNCVRNGLLSVTNVIFLHTKIVGIMLCQILLHKLLLQFVYNLFELLFKTVKHTDEFFISRNIWNKTTPTPWCGASVASTWYFRIEITQYRCITSLIFSKALFCFSSLFRLAFLMAFTLSGAVCSPSPSITWPK